MQLFTQLWPAVIEILSVVLCDYCSNEFSMAVIFSLMVFSLQVKTCRMKMTETTKVYAFSIIHFSDLLNYGSFLS